MTRRITGKTTDLMNEIPPPPGLSAPSRRSMEVEPTEVPPQDVEMGEQTEEGDQKRLEVLSINHVGVLKQVKMGENDKAEETEIRLNEEVEELASTKRHHWIQLQPTKE